MTRGILLLLLASRPLGSAVRLRVFPVAQEFSRLASWMSLASPRLATLARPLGSAERLPVFPMAQEFSRLASWMSLASPRLATLAGPLGSAERLRVFPVAQEFSRLASWMSLASPRLATLAGPLGSAEPTFDHSAWARVLARFVRAGRVDYAGLAHSRRDLDAYLALLGRAQASNLPPREQLAFWINAYNACVVAGVLRSWPVRSVREAPEFFRRPRCQVAGKTRALDELVQDIIRPTFKDARALLALAPGTRGGPPLASVPYAGA